MGLAAVPWTHMVSKRRPSESSLALEMRLSGLSLAVSAGLRLLHKPMHDVEMEFWLSWWSNPKYSGAADGMLGG